MKQQELKIEGMSCGHCIMAVKQSLAMLPNVVVKEVALGRAVVQYDERVLRQEDLEQAVQDAGYSVVKSSQ
ncbi:MAG: copper chaperone [Bacteroidia bacterium]|nr:MAG: copper chaperone [Bacteroidia bacterium]